MNYWLVYRAALRSRPP